MFSGKTKAAWQRATAQEMLGAGGAPRRLGPVPGGGFGMSPGCTAGTPPGLGTLIQTPASRTIPRLAPRLWVPIGHRLRARTAAPAAHRPGGGGGGHRWQLPRLRARAAVVEKKKNKPQLPVGSAVGCRKPPKFANGFTPAARAPRGHGCAGRAHPSLCCRWDPHPKRLSPLGALPGRVRPQPPAGSLPGRGGSQEGKNQKQIAGVNGAEPRAASAAAV